MAHKKPQDVARLRAFRHQISVLKKKGLVSPKVDARSVKITRHFKGVIKQYKNVLEGRAASIKLPREQLKAFAELGDLSEFKLSKNKQRLIVPKEPTERVNVSHGKFKIVHPSGITRLQIPCRYHDLEQYLDCVRKNKRKIDAMKTNQEYFAFRLFGHGSSDLFSDIETLVEKLHEYDSIYGAIDDDDPEAMNEIYQNLEIVKLPKRIHGQTATQIWTDQKLAARKEQRKLFRGKGYYRTQYRRRREKLERGPEWRLEQELELRAERQREYRERIKRENSAAYQKELEAGRERAKESYQKRRKGK